MTGFVKHDGGKAQLSLLPYGPLGDIAKVLEFGAIKYARDDWRKGGDINRFIDAALRHIFSYNEGEDIDPESGLPHLAHAGCNILFALELIKMYPDRDYRNQHLKE